MNLQAEIILIESKNTYALTYKPYPLKSFYYNLCVIVVLREALL